MSVAIDQINLENILNASGCEDVFEPDEMKIRAVYLELVKRYHPDVCNDTKANECIAKLTALKDEALNKVRLGSWNATGSVKFKTADGRVLVIPYLVLLPFELGQQFVGRTQVAYLFDKDYKRYFLNALDRIEQLRYADSGMEKEFGHYLPRVLEAAKLENGGFCLILQKVADVYPLGLLLRQQGGKLEPRHVAWIISRLCNLSCFLKFNGLVHNGLTIDSCFVSTEEHAIMLYGGWWYTVARGEGLAGMTREVFDLLSVRCKSEKKGEYLTDLECIRNIGEKLLGGHGVIYGNQRSIPKPMVEWLAAGPSGDAFEDFERWNRVLTDSWGERRFIRLTVGEIEIYKI